MSATLPPKRERSVYYDGLLTVAPERVAATVGPLTAGYEPVHNTPHFAVYEAGERFFVAHRFTPDGIDNDLAEYVAAELVRPALIPVEDAFERCFAGVVESSFGTPGEAWDAFYRNTLSRLVRVMSGEFREDDYRPIPVFGRIYAHAASLVEGETLLDVGTCFGFFPLALERVKRKIGHADKPSDITALDLSGPLVSLARRQTRSVSFVRGDMLDLPFPDESFDTVTCLHVLEHLPERGDVERAVSELCRVARGRVVVAVPLEEEPDGAFGHAGGFDRRRLASLVPPSGWDSEVGELLGGWCVLTRSGR